MADTGRKPLYEEPLTRTMVSIREEDKDLFRELGNGNVSEGVRHMVDRYRKLRDIVKER